MTSSQRKRFSTMLRSYRERLGISQTLLAERVRVGERSIRDWEKGEYVPKQQQVEGLLVCLEIVPSDYQAFKDAAQAAREEHTRERRARRAGVEVTNSSSSHNDLVRRYALLAPDHQTLFMCLAVFAGSWTVDAAYAICTLSSGVKSDLEAMLHALLDNNLIQHDKGDPARWTMHPSARTYALTQLDEQTWHEDVRRRYIDWFMVYAERAMDTLDGSEQIDSLRDFDTEYDNLQSAFRWAVERSEGDVALRIAAAVALYWQFRRPIAEGRAWLESALRCDEQSGASRRDRGLIPARIAVLAAAGNLAVAHGEYAIGLDFHSESLALAEQRGDTRAYVLALNELAGIDLARGDYVHAASLLEHAHLRLEILEGDTIRSTIADTLIRCAWLARDQGEYEEALGLLQQGLSLLRQANNARSMAEASLALGWLLLYLGRYGEAATVIQEAYTLAGELKASHLVVRALDHLALIHLEQGHYVKASRLLDQGLELAATGDERTQHAWMINKRGLIALEQDECVEARFWIMEGLDRFQRGNGGIEDRTGIAVSQWQLGWLALREGDIEDAYQRHRDSLALLSFRFLGDERNVAYCLEGLAAIALERSPAKAHALWTAAETIRSEFAIPLPPADRARYTPYVVRLHAAPAKRQERPAPQRIRLLEDIIATAVADDATTSA